MQGPGRQVFTNPARKGRAFSGGSSLYDLVVVGSGPTGSRLAARVAEAGLRTLLVEEHEQVGLPVHCTGIVSEEMLRRYAVPDTVRTVRLNRFDLITPTGRRARIPGLQAWLINRRKLDQSLASQAVQRGAELLMGTPVEAVKPVGHHLDLVLKDRRVTTRLCALATGAMSTLPQRCGLKSPPAFWQTAQLRAELADLAGVEVYLEQSITPGSFSYAVPVPGETPLLGLITRSGAWPAMHRFLERLGKSGRLGPMVGKATCRRIPMGPSPRSVRGRLMAVGDAAGQAKTTTGGGIYFGMMCADLLADTILEARSGGDFLPARLAGYDQRWKKRFRTELRAGYLARRIFEHVDDRELEELAGMLEDPEIRGILVREADYDCHLPLMNSLLRLPSVRRAALNLVGRRFPGASLLALLQRVGPGVTQFSWRNT